MGRRAGRARAAAGVGATVVVVASVLVWSANAEAPVERTGPAAATLPTVSMEPPTPDGDAATAVRPQRCEGTRGRTVLVDLSEQTLWLCRGGVTDATSPVTTGKADHETPTGSWRVYARQTDRWLSGEGYSRQVDFWMPFFRGYGFHDSSWQTIPYGSALVSERGSRGCVHVPRPMMKRLHRWADVGTRVRIVR